MREIFVNFETTSKIFQTFLSRCQQTFLQCCQITRIFPDSFQISVSYVLKVKTRLFRSEPRIC